MIQSFCLTMLYICAVIYLISIGAIIEAKEFIAFYLNPTKCKEQGFNIEQQESLAEFFIFQILLPQHQSEEALLVIEKLQDIPPRKLEQWASTIRSKRDEEKINLDKTLESQEIAQVLPTINHSTNSDVTYKHKTENEHKLVTFNTLIGDNSNNIITKSHTSDNNDKNSSLPIMVLLSGISAIIAIYLYFKLRNYTKSSKPSSWFLRFRQNISQIFYSNLAELFDMTFSYNNMNTTFPRRNLNRRNER